jgi:hypothetical protein
MNSHGYFLETTTFTDTHQDETENYKQREDRRTHNVGQKCIIGGIKYQSGERRPQRKVRERDLIGRRDSYIEKNVENENE